MRETRRLASTDLEVSPICLGTAVFGSPELGCDEREARAIFDAFREAGGNFVDTADTYAGGASEQIVGQLLNGCRDDIVLATKVGQAVGANREEHGLSRAHIIRGLDASLRRLGTDYIDLYLIHSMDPRTPMEETLDALDECVRAGKVRHVGCSNIEAWRLAQALNLSRERGLAEFVCVQLRYSLISREIEREHLPLCEQMGLATTAYNPLSSGLLTGKVGPGGPPPDSRLAKSNYYEPLLSGPPVELAARVAAIAAELGVSSAQLALAWAMNRPGITSVLSGARLARQISENMAALDLEIPADALAQLEVASQIRLGHPYEDIMNIEEWNMRPAGAGPPAWPAAWVTGRQVERPHHPGDPGKD